jgi:hypothetical protein
MRAWDKENKDEILYKLSIALYKLLKENKLSNRGLAKEAGMEYGHFQKISRGKIEAGFTTIIAIVNGLGISFTQLAQCYDTISEEDRKEYDEDLQKQKEIRGRRKSSL